MRKSMMNGAVGLVGVLLMTGCLFGQGATPQTVASTRASKEFPCPAEQLKVEELSSTSFRISGCGNTATYTCMGGNVGNPYDAVCQREAAAPAAAPPAH
jgi:hypothetical protein